MGWITEYTSIMLHYRFKFYLQIYSLYWWESNLFTINIHLGVISEVNDIIEEDGLSICRCHSGYKKSGASNNFKKLPKS
jgi:hypothetical protein